MLQLEDARQKILETIQPLPSESVPLSEACGRILAVSISSDINLPPFDNSAMDGYAVQSPDLARACADAPVSLRLVGEVAAGSTFSGKVEPGTCLRIFTGSPLPVGADAVLMQEDTRVDAASPGQIECLDTVKPWENVRFQGEDVKVSTPLGQPGDKLTAGRVSLLAACGIKDVPVFRRPIIGLLATGSELAEAGQSLAPGQIYESNRAGLSALIQQTGGVPKMYPLVKDSLEATVTALKAAFAECDTVITSGGVSVGEYDFVKNAFEKIGGHLSFWKVAIRPGKPFVFGQCQGKSLFGVPGNPVSALVTFWLLVRPALVRLQGTKEPSSPGHSGILSEPFSNEGDRSHFVRVTVDHSGHVRSSGTQASHILSSLAQADGLIEVPPKTTLAQGSTVFILRWS